MSLAKFGDEYDQKAVDVIQNLAMLVRRLCHRLHKHEPDAKMIDQALGYLRGEGLQGSVLRAGDSVKGEGETAPTFEQMKARLKEMEDEDAAELVPALSPEELAREIIVDFGRAPAKTALFNLHVSKLSALLRKH